MVENESSVQFGVSFFSTGLSHCSIGVRLSAIHAPEILNCSIRGSTFASLPSRSHANSRRRSLTQISRERRDQTKGYCDNLPMPMFPIYLSVNFDLSKRKDIADGYPLDTVVFADHQSAC